MVNSDARFAGVEIDSSKCQGHGRCYTLAPELFDVDDEGYGIVRGVDVGPELDQLADRAIAECPERAISRAARATGVAAPSA